MEEALRHYLSGTLGSEELRELQAIEERVREQAEAGASDGAFATHATKLCPNCQKQNLAYISLRTRSGDEGDLVAETCSACRYTRAVHD